MPIEAYLIIGISIIVVVALIGSMYASIIAIRMVVKDGRYRFQRHKKFLFFKWWEFIPYAGLYPLEYSKKQEALKTFYKFKRQLKGESKNWTVLEEEKI